MPTLFDPLRYLQLDLHALPSVGPDGIVLRFDGPVLPHQRKKALAVVKTYEKLLKLQLENGGASVQKLMAWGKLRVEGRRYAGFNSI
jgi:hypothetical protein